MSNGKNYMLEEYKILKEESKIFTNQTFRDFQLFIGIITIFFALVNSKETSLPKFANYAFMQVAVFVFMIIQFSRIVYLLIIRKHLSELEHKMNSSYDKNHIFQWESKIIPTMIAPRFSYSTVNQFVIGLTYFGVFIILCCKSLQHSTRLDSNNLKDLIMPLWVYYYVILPIELIFICYSLYCIRKQSKQLSVIPTNIPTNHA